MVAQVLGVLEKQTGNWCFKLVQNSEKTHLIFGDRKTGKDTGHILDRYVDLAHTRCAPAMLRIL